ncbi:hypothetical protein DP939_42060 [Spongiactinospora rosea]|uniref:FtsX-like permease family protein n=1 Tax=Spongiactinospora rosea TaxID=2248750 RepID=A0A366LJT9_9ACTN|nr:hypothetical protein DP939_42060 [Spongiactinospora rosea]
MAMLVVSVLLAFLVLEDLDTEPTLGETATVWVTETQGAANISQTAKMVTSFARKHRVSVVREVHDFHNPDRLLHLYIATGDDASAPASWLRQGFSAFGRSVRTETHMFQEIGFPDPRGMYHVYGPHRAVEQLRTEFAMLGLTGKVVEPAGLGWRIQRFAQPPLGPVFIVMTLSVALMAGASVVLSAKGYAILRLHGFSFVAMLRRDLRRLGLFWGMAVGAVAVVTLIFLGLYNGFTRLGLFALVAGALAGTLTVLALFAHTGALALVLRGRLQGGLKGELASGPALVGAYLVRLTAALLVFVVGGIALTAGHDVARRQQSQPFFAALGEATYISLTGSRTAETGQEMARQVGQWLRRADRRGEIIVAYRWPLEWFGGRGGSIHEGDLLFVNDTFLARQPILDSSGKRYRPGLEGRVRVIVPKRLRAYADTITQSVPEWISPEDKGKRVRRAGVDRVWAKDGQTVFAYSSANTMEALDRSLLRDPVLVVLPNGTRLVSDGGYTAMATKEGVIFLDPRDVVAALEREVPREHISEMNPVAQRAAEDYAEATHVLRLSLLSLAAAVAVLFIAGMGVCVIYTRKNAQAVFAKYISGWSFVRIHRRLLALDAVTAAGLLAWVGWGIWSRVAALEEFAALGVPPPPGLPEVGTWQLAPAAGIALVAAILLLAVLGIAHRQIIQKHAADV